MKFRLVTSLLLIAVLTALYLWLVRPDEPAAEPATITTTDPATTPGLGRIRIF
jgi:hypothetical protein